MEHKGTVQLETPRLILRRVTMEDAEAAFQNWTSEEQVTQFLCWPTHKNSEETREIFQRWVANYENMNNYLWGIVLKEDGGRLIGTISAVEQDESLNKVHIGYCIGSRWWHRGITSEAFARIIAFFFEEVRVNRIEARHDPQNPNSGKVMLKCGLTHEGTLREADSNNRGIVDVAMYSILAKEYFADK